MKQQLSPEVRALGAQIYASRVADKSLFRLEEVSDKVGEFSRQAEVSIRLASVFYDYLDNRNPLRTLSKRDAAGYLAPPQSLDEADRPIELLLDNPLNLNEPHE